VDARKSDVFREGYEGCRGGVGLQDRAGFGVSVSGEDRLGRCDSELLEELAGLGAEEQGLMQRIWRSVVPLRIRGTTTTLVR